MNILLVGLIILLIWRVCAGLKKGVVHETIAFINIIFGSVVLGMVCMIFGAYHEQNYLGIALMVVGIAVLSVAYSLLKIIFFSAKVISKLPVVSTADKLLGIGIGAAETLILFWGMCCAFMYADFGVLEEQIMTMITENTILTGLYQYNLLGVLLDIVKAKLA